MIVRLSNQFVKHQLICPTDKKQIEFVDSDRSGLYILVSRTSPNRGTYYERYKNAAGKTCHRKLARTDDISLAEAKAMVKKLRAEIALGGDPQAEIKHKRAEMTYGEFMKLYYFPYITPRRRNAARYRRLYETQIKQEFGDVKVNAITKRQVQAFHNSLHSQGFSNAYCNRFLQLIKSSFNVGINIMETIDIKNPAVGIPLFEEESRERFLVSEELGRLLPILIEDGSQPAKMARFMLATGLRLGECMNCRWDEISLEHCSMTIESARSKSKRSAAIPLNPAAIQVLQECDKGTPYPFVNLATGKPYTTISKSFKRFMKEADLKDVTCHTLRHTAASIMINAGESLYAVQKVLRHSSSAVTEKYAHLSTQSVMSASNTISEQLLRAASGES